jgi:putative tricarboxylic transport membrane protein
LARAPQRGERAEFSAAAFSSPVAEVLVKTQRVADIAVGGFLALFGVFVLIAATNISVAGVHRLSPRTFPYTVAVLLIVCGVGLALKAWTLRGEDPAIAWPDAEGVRTLVVTLLSLGAYIVLLTRLGLPLATVLYIAFFTWYLKPSKWWLAVLIGLVVGVVSYTVFIRLLGLSFPAGPFLEG